MAVTCVVLLATLAAAPPSVGAQEVDSGTTFRFDLRTDGDAHVTVTTRYVLSDEADRRAFDQLADEHTSGRNSPLSVEPFRQAASRASEVTGRPMAIENVTWTKDRTDESGRLTLAFTWTNFSNVSGNRLSVGDVFRTPDGTWLPGLSDGQELVISFPEGYTPQSISLPGTRFQVINGSIRVEGPATFEPRSPSVVLVGPGGPSTPPPLAGLPWMLIVGTAGGVLLVSIVVLGILFRSRLPAIGSADAADDPGDPGAAVVGETEPADGPDRTDDPDPMDQPLLSDEERVLRLLHSEGGRMKQVAIVEATDWSNAKVSQLLSEMAEEGRIDKLRIGRENLISLPGQGPGEE